MVQCTVTSQSRSRLDWTELNRIEMNSTDLYWTELNQTELYWIELNWNVLNWTELKCTELNCTEPNCTELKCTELNWAELNHSKPNHDELNSAFLPVNPGAQVQSYSRLSGVGVQVAPFRHSPFWHSRFSPQSSMLLLALAPSTRSNGSPSISTWKTFIKIITRIISHIYSQTCL